jgi:hypothetical protein
MKVESNLRIKEVGDNPAVGHNPTLTTHAIFNMKELTHNGFVESQIVVKEVKSQRKAST